MRALNDIKIRALAHELRAWHDRGAFAFVDGTLSAVCIGRTRTQGAFRVVFVADDEGASCIKDVLAPATTRGGPPSAAAPAYPACPACWEHMEKVGDVERALRAYRMAHGDVLAKALSGVDLERSALDALLGVTSREWYEHWTRKFGGPTSSASDDDDDMSHDDGQPAAPAPAPVRYVLLNNRGR